MQLIKQFLRGSETKYFVTAFLSSLLCIGEGFATVPSLKFPTQVFHAAIDWVLDKTVGGVDFYHAITICDGKKVVFLKFDNRNTYPVKVSWKEVFTTQEGAGVEGYFGKKTIVIKTGESAETNCKEPSMIELLILPHQVVPTYLADILKFEFTEINITKTQ